MRTTDPAKGDPKTPWTFYLVFSLIAVFSAVGLDYIHWSRGNKSYIFAAPKKPEKPEVPRIALDLIVQNRLSSEAIPEDSVSKFKDKAGIDHMKVDLSHAEYTDLEGRLDQDLQNAGATVVNKEEQEDEEKKYYLWDVRRFEEEKLAILFSCDKKPAATPEPPADLEPTNKVALIMDDMGYSLDVIYDIIGLQEPITVAIIPFSPLGKQTAQLAHQNGMEVLLHLPLESINGSEAGNGIEGIILTDMSEQEIIATVDKDLDQIPFISGVNNHMGSKITPDLSAMDIILRRVKQRGLFFVDSRTTAYSVAYDLARQLDIPTAQRHVFLDNKSDESTIRENLIELFSLARTRGEAVGICHPLPETVEVLKDFFRLAREYGVKPVFASEIVR